MRSKTRLVYHITKYIHYFTYFLEILNIVVVVLRHKSEVFNLKTVYSLMIFYVLMIHWQIKKPLPKHCQIQNSNTDRLYITLSIVSVFFYLYRIIWAFTSTNITRAITSLNVIFNFIDWLYYKIRLYYDSKSLYNIVTSLSHYINWANVYKYVYNKCSLETFIFNFLILYNI